MRRLHGKKVTEGERETSEMTNNKPHDISTSTLFVNEDEKKNGRKNSVQGQMQTAT